ncbi:MAG: DUF4097 family beta strand repeat-containing protein [Candidatus Coproplasma sp.]
MIKRGIYGGLCAVLGCIAVIFSAMAFAGCAYTHSGGGETTYEYDNAESYAVGGGSVGAEISSVETDWISGDIKVEYADVQYCSLSEENGDEAIPEDWQLRFLVEGGTLKIKYVKAGTWKFDEFSKSLKITLPYGAELEEFRVNAVSATVYADQLTANGIDIDSVSGSVSIVTVNAEEITVDSVSGNVKLGFEKLPVSVKLDSVSSNVYLTVPEGSAFTLKLSAVSGVLKSELEYSKSGSEYSFGGGETVFNINTVSGNVTVE